MTLPLLLASAAQPGIAETFGLETKYIIMQVISFLVVLGVLYQFDSSDLAAPQQVRPDVLHRALCCAVQCCAEV